MASFLDKVKVNTALDSRAKFDLGCDHITTGSWMQFTPVFNKELVPKERIDVSMETFTRMLPLNYPTFGRANIHNSAFFVPYRTIFPAWNDFITDSVHVNGSGNANGAIVTSVPQITNANFINAFFGDTNMVNEVESTDPFDYCVSTSDGIKYFTLTSVGRQIMKILNSLGYNFKMDVVDSEVYSALPLLAVIKIYVDWYYPSAYSNESDYQQLLAITKYDATSANQILTVSQLSIVFNMIGFVQYDSDYFTSCWDNPVGPNSGNATSFRIGDPAIGAGYNPIVTNINNSTTISQNTPVLTREGSQTNTLLGSVTQYAVDALKKLTDYLKRHQLVGSKAIDRYLSRFGVQLSDDKLDRSLQIGRQMVSIQIGDVMSNADTSGASLGDYAGRGLGYGQDKFDFETTEYGQFVIISSIVPSIGYYQGVDRNVKHLTKLDFWTPEFDALGSQVVTADELYISNNYNSGFSGVSVSNQIFGWLPRYAEYKVARDRVTGDYRYDSMNTGEDAWYLMRKFDDTSFSYVTDMVHSPSFMTGADSEQYNRIFNTGTSAADCFKMIYHFEIGDYSPMKPLYENYEFEDKGKEVVEDVNGVKLN